MTSRINVPHPVATGWGDIGMVQAVLCLVHHARSLWPDAKQFMVLPGDAMPLVPALEFLQAAPQGTSRLNVTTFHKHDIDLVSRQNSRVVLCPNQLPVFLRDLDVPMAAHSLEMIISKHHAKLLDEVLRPNLEVYFGALADHQPFLGTADEYMIGTFLQHADRDFDRSGVNSPFSAWFSRPDLTDNKGEPTIRAELWTDGATNDTRGELVMLNPVDTDNFTNIEAGLTSNLVVERLLSRKPLYVVQDRITDDERGEPLYVGELVEDYLDGFLFFRKLLPGLADPTGRAFWGHDVRPRV
jgi:hypothetical protein